MPRAELRQERDFLQIRPQETGRFRPVKRGQPSRNDKFRDLPMPFRYRGLPLAPFAPLFALSDAGLAEKGFKRMVVDEKPGFPCRITLEDAEPGERVLL